MNMTLPIRYRQNIDLKKKKDVKKEQKIILKGINIKHIAFVLKGSTFYLNNTQQV